MLSVFYHILTYIQFLQNTSLTYTILHTYAHTDLKHNLNLFQDTEKAPHHRGLVECFSAKGGLYENFYNSSIIMRSCPSSATWISLSLSPCDT